MRIIGNEKHGCPGCGAVFRAGLEEEIVRTPGWIDMKRLQNRLYWVDDAQSGEPQIYVSGSKVLSDDHAIGNKFVRQSDWLNRQYTLLENQRILKRLGIPDGQANIQLQTLLRGINEKWHHVHTSGTTNIEEEALSSTSEISGLPPKPKTYPLICQRCHDLKHDGREWATFHSPRQDKLLNLDEKGCRVVKEHLTSRAIVVLIVDLLDIPFSIPPQALQKLCSYQCGGEEAPGLVLVGNKTDLLPKHLRKAAEYLHKMVSSQLEPNLRRQILGEFFVSSKKGTGVDELKGLLSRMARERRGSIFLLGQTNVGKSSLYNNIIGNNIATVSSTAGTTVGTVAKRLVNITSMEGDLPTKLPGDLFLIDLPGISNNNDQLLSNLLTREEMNMAMIKNPIRVMKRMLTPGEMLLIAGLIRIQCIGDDSKIRVMLKLYMRRDVPTFRMRIDEVNGFILNWLGRRRPDPPYLVPPILPTGCEEPRWPVFAQPELATEFTVTGRKMKEVVFSDGIGWISAHLANDHEQVKLHIYTPKALGAIVRPPWVS